MRQSRLAKATRHGSRADRSSRKRGARRWPRLFASFEFGRRQSPTTPRRPSATARSTASAPAAHASAYRFSPSQVAASCQFKRSSGSLAGGGSPGWKWRWPARPFVRDRVAHVEPDPDLLPKRLIGACAQHGFVQVECVQSAAREHVGSAASGGCVDRNALRVQNRGSIGVKDRGPVVGTPRPLWFPAARRGGTFARPRRALRLRHGVETARAPSAGRLAPSTRRLRDPAPGVHGHRQAGPECSPDMDPLRA